MRICYLVSEYFRWGQFGGYGTITRSVGEGLAARGHEVYALVPKRTEQARREQRDMESIDGVTVVGLPHSYLLRLHRRHLYRIPKAQIYVSVDPRFDSWMAMGQNPGARHCIWFLDPMGFDTYWRLHRDDPREAGTWEKLGTAAAFHGLQFFARRAVQRADALFTQPSTLSDEARALFPAGRPVHFLPNPVTLPPLPIGKSDTPLVLFLGRFDWQKQPERFFALAREFPEAEFVAAGASTDRERDAKLRRACAGILNLRLPGVVTGEAKDRLLRRAWILCNTSLREGLPRSMQEALAYGMAILAGVDPDGYASRFGYHAADGDFSGGLRALLDGDRWRSLGRAGRDHIAETYDSRRALDDHEAMYRDVLAGRLR